MPYFLRPSVIAGTWYPGTKETLQSTIHAYFQKVKVQQLKGTVLGLISPHAGYPYSGQVAAYGYKQIIGKSIDIVVILSPFHQIPAGRYMTSSATHYSTPLGEVAINKALLEKVSKQIDLTYMKYDNEHSLEIQLPFLQMALKEFSLLPIMVGHDDVYGCEDIVTVLVNTLEEKNMLIIASTDLHHIPDYNEVVRRDKEVVETLANFNLASIRKVLSDPHCSVCGRVPVSIVVDVAQQLGANRCVVLNQTNSGDVTGEKSKGQYTVGYLSAAILKAC